MDKDVFGWILTHIDKKMKFVRNKKKDKRITAHGLTGKYFENVMASKKVMKSIDVGEVFEEEVMWLGKINQEEDECEEAYPNFAKVYGKYVNATRCAMCMRLLRVHGAHGNISEFDHNWLLNIPNFQKFYKRENGPPRNQKYLKRIVDSLNELNDSNIMFASWVELKQCCGLLARGNMYVTKRKFRTTWIVIRL